MSTERLAGSSEDKSPWNWRDFCGEGNKQPQPALVPSPERGVGSILFAAQRCGHSSCWPTRERQLLMVAHQGLGCQRSFFRKDLDNSRVGRGAQLLLNAEPQTMKGVGEGTISPPLAFPEFRQVTGLCVGLSAPAPHSPDSQPKRKCNEKEQLPSMSLGSATEWLACQLHTVAKQDGFLCPKEGQGPCRLVIHSLILSGPLSRCVSLNR